jgi:hypothetical protein
MSELVLREVTNEEDSVTHHYECDRAVELAGDSIWDCEVTGEIRITDIIVHEYPDYKDIGVYYTVDGDEEAEESWRIYTDTGFEAAVSELLGYSVSFTEQGMQDNGRASMEAWAPMKFIGVDF